MPTNHKRAKTSGKPQASGLPGFWEPSSSLVEISLRCDKIVTDPQGWWKATGMRPTRVLGAGVMALLPWAYLQLLIVPCFNGGEAALHR